MRLRLLILLILTTAAFTAAQTHSQWFYNPSSINCSKIAVGYAPRSYYADTTALKNAFLNACENYAKYERVQVMGNRSYWSTENGTYTMNSSFSEVYDTAMAASLCRSLKIIDTMITESYLAVAVGSCSYEEAAGSLPDDAFDTKPVWVEAIPGDDEYIYSSGSAPLYYYEINSWLDAEKLARRNLAFALHSKTSAVEKKLDQSGEQMKNEETSVCLSNLQIISRYKDKKENICYVLIRMKKSF